MSVVIIGGNERMERMYINMCKNHGYSAKVFTKTKRNLKNRLGTPNLVIFFTSTVSHNMVNCVMCEAKKCSACIKQCHSSSLSALDSLLTAHKKGA